MKLSVWFHWPYNYKELFYTEWFSYFWYKGEKCLYGPWKSSLFSLFLFMVMDNWMEIALSVQTYACRPSTVRYLERKYSFLKKKFWQNGQFLVSLMLSLLLENAQRLIKRLSMIRSISWDPLCGQYSPTPSPPSHPHTPLFFGISLTLTHPLQITFDLKWRRESLGVFIFDIKSIVVPLGYCLIMY